MLFHFNFYSSLSLSLSLSFSVCVLECVRTYVRACVCQVSNQFYAIILNPRIEFNSCCKMSSIIPNTIRYARNLFHSQGSASIYRHRYSRKQFQLVLNYVDYWGSETNITRFIFLLCVLLGLMTHVLMGFVLSLGNVIYRVCQ